MAVLERGGNAFDAAVATAFMLQVAEPHLNGPGGDAPIILHDAQAGAQQVICGQGVAPAGATLEAFRALDIDLIPATGLLPAVVPGAFDAWCLLLRDWGTWELADVLAFAIGYAANGIHARAAHQRHDRGRAPAVRSRVAHQRRGVPARRQGAGTGQPVRPSGACRDLSSASAAKPSAPRAKPASMPPAAPGIAASSPRRWTGSVANTEVLDITGQRHRGLLTGGDIAAWSATVEDAAHLRLSRPHRAEMRPMEPGPGVPATACAAARLRYRRDGPDRRGLRPHRRRVRETRLRRPRGLLRRSRFRHGAARGRCCRTTTTRSAAR